MEKLYAVANGKTKGIFNTWAECNESVNGFEGAIFKKFDNKKDAELFISSNRSLPNNKLIQNVSKFKTSTKNDKYTNINFDSDSDSDEETSKTNLSNKLISKNKIIVSSKTLSKLEETIIRENINFDSESDSDSEIKVIKKSNKPDKLDLLIANQKNIIITNNNSDDSENLLSDPEYLRDLGDFIPDYNIYTDGACINNGKTNAKAAIGIYFGKNDSRNVSEKLSDDEKQSNNTAELQAIIKTYDIIKQDIQAGKKIVIYSDSVYAIRAATTYGEKVSKIDYKDIINKELIKQIYTLYLNKKNIKFRYIEAHTDKKDIHSRGNKEADELANQALENCSSNDLEVNKKIYANVPFANSNIFYYKKIYLNVPFAKKDEAKKLGAFWDAEAKKWYIKDNIDEIKKNSILQIFNINV